MSLPHRRRIGADVLIPFILLALVFGGLFWQKYQEARQLAEPVVTGPREVGERRVILFFVDDTAKLSREARQVDDCQDSTTCLRSILEELFSGPIGDLDPAVPEWTSINSVSIEGTIAAIDLEKGFSEALQPGSSAEMLAVYAIVNTICVNLPEITQVRLTLAGENMAHLRHLDLSEPFSPDFSLESQSIHNQNQQPNQIP